MSKYITLEETAQLLADMQDEEGVAFMCAMFGIRGAVLVGGDPPYACHCPVARFITLCTGKTYPVDMCLMGRTFEDDVRTPTNVAIFIAEYDAGRWPELWEVV